MDFAPWRKNEKRGKMVETKVTSPPKERTLFAAQLNTQVSDRREMETKRCSISMKPKTHKRARGAANDKTKRSCQLALSPHRA